MTSISLFRRNGCLENAAVTVVNAHPCMLTDAENDLGPLVVDAAELKYIYITSRQYQLYRSLPQ